MARSDRDLDLDDEEEDRPRWTPRRITAIGVIAARVGVVVMTVCAALVAKVAFVEFDHVAPVGAGLACCAGIFARICQAESHHLARR